MKRVMRNFILSVAMVTSIVASAQNQNFQKVQVRTMNGMKWGYVDARTNKRIIEAKYDEVQDFYDGITSVSISGKAGLIDTTGRVLLALEYAKVIMLGDRMAMVSKVGNKFALASADNKILTEEIYEDMLGFSSGFCATKKGGKWGYLNKQGKPICNFEFDNADTFHNGNAKVGKKSGFQNSQFENILNAGIINDHGQIVAEIKYNYDKTMVLNDGRIMLALDLKSNTSMGYATAGTINALLDKNGKPVIPLDQEYTFENPYDNFLFVSLFKNNARKYGFLDWNGKEILPVNFYKIDFIAQNNSWIAKVSFDPNNFFYLNDKFECFEYKGVPCPEK